MNREEIIEYIRRNNGARIPELQSEFGVTYKEAKDIVDGLVADRRLVYESGVKYNYVKSTVEVLNERAEEYERLKAQELAETNDEEDEDFDLDDLLDFDDGEDDEDDEMDAKFAEYERYLREHMDDDFDDEEDPFDKEYDKLIDQLYRENEEAMKPGVQNLVNVLKRIAEKKSAPVTTDKLPDFSLWTDDDEFAAAVSERFKKLILTDKQMDRLGAIKKAESWLEAVRDTHDRKMVQLYERLVFEVKNTNDYQFSYMKKWYFK